VGNIVLAAAAERVVLIEYLERGGKWMYPLVLCSVLALTVILYKLIYFYIIRLNVRQFLRRIVPLIAGGETAQARSECAGSKSPVAAVVGAGLESANGRREIVRETMEEEAQQQISLVEHYLPLLATVAAIAPLFGFLGTVTGMIEAFDTIRHQANIEASAVAGGISKALITTAFGLMVAIPVYTAYNYFVARVRAVERDIDAATAQIVNELCPEAVERAA